MTERKDAAVIWNQKYETMGRESLAQVQLERLQATLNRALRNVAFSRESLARTGVKGDEIRSIEDLARLPFTTKEDLRTSYPYGMFAVPLRDIVRIQSTSGTTGTPVVVGYTRNDLRTWSECVARLLAAGGLNEHDVVQVAFTYGIRDPRLHGLASETGEDHEGFQNHRPGLHAQLRSGDRRDRR
jgi:phenylacetate-CoA ligase